MRSLGEKECSAFKDLKKIYNNFKCYVYTGNPEVHSKVYVWSKNETNLVAFVGSSNYSNPGFNENLQGNVLINCDPSIATNYIENLKSECIDIEKYQTKINKQKEVLEKIEERFPLKKLKKNNLSFFPNALSQNEKNRIERRLDNLDVY